MGTSRMAENRWSSTTRALTLNLDLGMALVPLLENPLRVRYDIGELVAFEPSGVEAPEPGQPWPDKVAETGVTSSTSNILDSLYITSGDRGTGAG